MKGKIATVVLLLPSLNVLKGQVRTGWTEPSDGVMKMEVQSLQHQLSQSSAILFILGVMNQLASAE